MANAMPQVKLEAAVAQVMDGRACKITENTTSKQTEQWVCCVYQVNSSFS